MRGEAEWDRSASGAIGFVGPLGLRMTEGGEGAGVRARSGNGAKDGRFRRHWAAGGKPAYELTVSGLWYEEEHGVDAA